jgi:hypothetical protein
MNINNWSFFKYCITISGYDFKDEYNKDIFKFQLYLKRIDPDKLINGATKYKLKRKTY